MRLINATNVIYHDKARPSALILPIVPSLAVRYEPLVPSGLRGEIKKRVAD